MPQKTIGFGENEGDEEVTGVVQVTNTSNRLKLAREYILIRKLGEGGMGEVHLGKTRLFGKEKLVAVKILDKKNPPMVDSVERFHREAELLGQVKHSNIVGFHDYWESERFAYLVMEYVGGEDLEAYVQEFGAFDLETAIVLLLQVLRALEYMAEEHGMHHRDIKPNNIQVVLGSKSHRGGLKAMLIDFGNAKIGMGDPEEKSLTMMSGQMAGTPGYTAPSVSMDNFAEEDDVFSIACTMMYCLLGKNLLEVGNDLWASWRKVQEGDFQLGQYEETMIGQWIRINVAEKREERMSLAQAIHSLERMLKDESKGSRKVSQDEVRLLSSDKALMARLAVKSNKPDNDIAHSSTMATDLLSQMTNPRINLADLVPAEKAVSVSDEPSPEQEKLEKALAAIETGVDLDRERRRKRRNKILISVAVLLLLAAVAFFLVWQFKIKPGQEKVLETKQSASQPVKPQTEQKPAAVKVVESKKSAPATVEAKLPSVKDLPRFKSVRQIYPQLRQSKKRQVLLADAETWARWAQAKDDQKAWQQAEWRWLAFVRKAPVPETEKLPVLRKLFNYYCLTKQLKGQQQMSYLSKKLGEKKALSCAK